ncbi:hypothetical protein [Actibacterium ureilyticum]|uniref:hypothetical protein n=1 Tax=Actibacterium ureilyticum TaxID=1590614 RepID=UPI000BAB108C|nr:hypothetical protein [Actibacterium ureilyticum]
MAQKKSAAELKAEGEELGLKLANARKKEYNFALMIAKEGVVFETDLKKGPDILWRNGRKAGGTAKGAKGKVRVKGKVVELHCDTEDVPGSLTKVAKKHFAERGQAYKFVVIPPSGAVSEDAADDEEEVQAATGRRGPGDGETGTEAQTAEAVEAVAEATGEAEEEVQAAVGDAQDPAEIERGLRDVLMAEFQELDLDTARQSPNAGAATKATKLAEMFSAQVESDVKKAGSVLSLLKTTVQEALAAMPAESAETDSGPDPEIARQRMADMSALESSVDALLAEFA